MQDRDEQNRRRPPRGILNGRATLTEAEVFDIKFRISEGERVSSIARSLGISISKVSHIKNGVTWVG
jgi:DNA-binding CsgD family transcriptional regulator